MPAIFTNGVWLFIAIPAILAISGWWKGDIFENWRAAAVLLLAITLGQSVFRLDYTQSFLLVGYVLLAVVAVFFIDWASGAILALVTLAILISHEPISLIDHVTKVRIGEAVLIFGSLVCGISGPSGGIGNPISRSADRIGSGLHPVPQNSAQSVPTAEKHSGL